MRRRRLSIGLRLTLWYLAIFLAAQAVFGLGMWGILNRSLYDIADDTLEGQIDDLQHFLHAQRGDASTAQLQEQFDEAYLREHSGDYLQVQDERGNWIYRAPFLRKNNLPAIRPDQLRKPLYEDRWLGGERFRFMSQNVEVHGRHYTVQTGVPEDDTLETLRLFKRYLLMFAPLMLAVAAGVGYWLSRRALSPVDALTRTARGITGVNLSSRLEKLDTGDELQRLAETLNEMLARIEAAFLRVTQFTADASHELRTPVSLIRTEAEIALRKSRGDGEYKDALQHILLEAERTSSLIERLLALARADAGHESLDFQTLELRELVRKSCEDWREVTAQRHLEFTSKIANRDLYITGDKTALRRLLNVLLDNAVKYTPAHGTIEVTLEEKDENALLRVRDTGIGISEEDQARIFERFYRADKARSREAGGVGLGLAIAEWIVEQHRGSITVESAPGKGATFMVRLPLEPSPVSTLVS